MSGEISYAIHGKGCLVSDNDFLKNLVKIIGMS